MTKRRVFLIWTNPIFHESARLLLNHPDITWAGASVNHENMREEIMRLMPDTILFERTEAGIPAGLAEMLDLEQIDMRIIGFSLEDDEMSLYHREHKTVLRAGDLVQFVLGRHTNQRRGDAKEIKDSNTGIQPAKNDDIPRSAQ